MRNTIVLLSLSSLFSSLAFAASNQSLQLLVGGNIYQTPSWMVNGANSSSATYNFSAFGTGTINSGSVTILLNNPSSLGGDTIALTPPTNCKVGNGNIKNSDVSFLVNGNTYSNPKISDFTNGSGVSTAIQFNNVATSGSVNCTAGTLTYTY